MVGRVALALGLLLPNWCNAGFSRHTCAIVEENDNKSGLKCWGFNDVGQAGTKQTPSIRPISVPDSENVVQVEVGPTITCAIFALSTDEEKKSDVKCWGLNYQGSGYGILDGPQWTKNLDPVNLGNDGASKFVTQVSVGLMHTCVILSDGNIKCWGQNQFGQLGLGDTKNRGNHLTGLWPKDQQIRCNNPYFKERVSCSKELNQITVKLGEYVPVSGDSADNKAVQAKQVACGYYHTCALVHDPSPVGSMKHSPTRVMCWGRGQFGVLGYGDKLDRNRPIPGDYVNIHPSGRPIQIAAGGFHNCVLLHTGEVVCWGSNEQGALGHKSSKHWLTYVGDQENEEFLTVPFELSIDGTLPLAVQLSAGIHRTCAALDNGNLTCWGTNEIHCGNGDAEDPIVTGLLGRGYGVKNIQNELNKYMGDSADDTFQQLQFPSSVVKQTFLGVCHACALLVPRQNQSSCDSAPSECSLPPERGTIQCWGNNMFHELGENIEKVETSKNIIGDALSETPDKFPQPVVSASQIKCDTPLQEDAQPRVGCECPAGYTRSGSKSGCYLVEKESTCAEGSCLYGRKCESIAPKVNKYGVMMPSNYSCDCSLDIQGNQVDADLSGTRCEIDTELPQMLSALIDENGDSKEWCRDHDKVSAIEVAKIKLSHISEEFKVEDKSDPENPIRSWKASMLEDPDYWNLYCRKPDREVEFLKREEATNCEGSKIGETISRKPWRKYFISDNTRNEISTTFGGNAQNKAISKGIRSVRVCSTEDCCAESEELSEGRHHLYFCITDLSGNLRKKFCSVEIVE